MHTAPEAAAVVFEATMPDWLAESVISIPMIKVFREELKERGPLQDDAGESPEPHLSEWIPCWRLRRQSDECRHRLRLLFSREALRSSTM